MKLRNKKTGEIIELLAKPSFVKRNDDYLQSEVNTFNSLAELNAEWEDYEEPKEYRYIDDAGVIQIDQVLSSEINMRKSIGNYFETKEEAEKAVEKLKALKRLKDKGFRFERWVLGMSTLTITFSDYIESDDETRADLDLLFSEVKNDN